MAAGAKKGTVGIDFGTSTTLVASKSATGRAETVPIGRRTPWLPSVIGVRPGGTLAVAEEAEALPRPSVIRSAKSAITRCEEALVTPSGQKVDVESAVRAMLSEAVKQARVNGVDVTHASTVQLGCPAMWRAPERQMLISVARACGIPADLGHVVDEPIAAGVAWIEDRHLDGDPLPDTKVLVFDPGGGTLDVALLQVRPSDKGSPEVTVLSADGTDESGDALDAAIATDCSRSADLQSLIDRDPVVFDLLSDRARDLKEVLSIDDRASRALGGGYPNVVNYTRDRVEVAFGGQWARAEVLVRSVVRAAKLREQQTLTNSEIRHLTWKEASDGITFVVLVGGLSQVPMVRSRLQSMFPHAEVVLVKQPQEAIVRGLALAERVERLNLHRPAFNFSLTFYDRDQQAIGGEAVLYPAFTPLYDWWQVHTMAGSLGHRSENFEAPAKAVQALLHCTTVDGHALRLKLNGEDLKGIAVSVKPKDQVGLKLYVNGDIVFGPKSTVRLRVKSWPTLRGKHHDWRMEVFEVPSEFSAQPIVDEWRFLH